jgi:hypothetical protein
MCADSHRASLSEKTRRDTRAFGELDNLIYLPWSRGGTNTRQDPESTLAKGREAEGTILRGCLGARNDISPLASRDPSPVQAEGLLKWKLNECEHTARAETRPLRHKMLMRGNHFSECGQVLFGSGELVSVCPEKLHVGRHAQEDGSCA